MRKEIRDIVVIVSIVFFSICMIVPFYIDAIEGVFAAEFEILMSLVIIILTISITLKLKEWRDKNE